MTPADDDPNSLERLRSGDEQAFELLVHQHEGPVLALARTMGFRGADLDDAASEIFARVYLSLPNFQGRSTLRTWIYSIAYRTLLKLRQRRKSPAIAQIDEEATDSSALTPADRAEQRETATVIWNAVATMDPRSATAVELYYRRGYGLREIGQVLDCPIGTVKTILHRARQQLRTVLGSLEAAP